MTTKQKKKKTEINEKDVFTLINDWEGSYKFTKSQGKINSVDMTKRYQTMSIDFMRKVQEEIEHEYEFLTFEIDIEKNILQITAKVNPNTFDHFIKFKKTLIRIEKKLEKKGLVVL